MQPALNIPPHATPAIYGRPTHPGQVIEFRFGRGERRVMKRRRQVLPSVWAEEHRVLTMSSIPGPWHNHVTPYLVGIMDALWHPAVDTLICCKAPQTGVTEAVYNCIGYSADCDPAPVLVVMPDEITARDNSRDRIQPMFSSSVRLSRYLTGSREDISGLRINLTQMPIYMAWARSASRLANRPIRFVFFDEVDKYPDFSNQREADPISLGTKRTITYRRTRKIVKNSTPTVESGPIWQAMTTEAQAVFDWMATCPDCRREQVMEFEHIKWPDGLRVAETVEQGRLAWYECRHCGAHWDDARRDMAVRAGCWRGRIGEEASGEHGVELMEHLDVQRPSKIGFHIPSWISHFVSLSDAAAAFLRGFKDKGKLRDFQNSHAARPWVVYQHVRKEDTILALRDDRPAGTVPSGGVVAAITAGVDTQDNGFWYEVRAWGYGLAEDSWQIRKGFVASFTALSEVLWGSEYTDASGVKYVVDFVLMDSAGHRTDEVYEFCRRNRGRILPTKGTGSMSATSHKFSKIDTFAGTSKSITGGLWLLLLAVNYYKDKLATKLEIGRDDPGAFRLCADADDDWARQMTAEVIDEKTQTWINPRNRANHAWDCSVLNLAAADVYRGGLRFLAPPPTAEGSAAEQNAVARGSGGGRW